MGSLVHGFMCALSHADIVLVHCIGSLYWFIVLVHCIDSLYWFIVLIPCIGSLYWFIVLVHCTDSMTRGAMQKPLVLYCFAHSGHKSLIFTGAIL